MPYQTSLSMPRYLLLGIDLLLLMALDCLQASASSAVSMSTGVLNWQVLLYQTCQAPPLWMFAWLHCLSCRSVHLCAYIVLSHLSVSVANVMLHCDQLALCILQQTQYILSNSYYIYIYRNTYTNIYVCVYIYICICMYVCVYIYVWYIYHHKFMYTYIDTHMADL